VGRWVGGVEAEGQTYGAEGSVRQSSSGVAEGGSAIRTGENTWQQGRTIGSY